jgi:Flp pilus assembly protein TadB
MPLSPKEEKFLASNRNALLQSTRQQEVRGLQLRTKQRIEALYEQERERNRRALLKEQRIVQRALLKEQSDYFLIVICIIILAFSAAVLFLQHCYLNHLKDNNSF